MDIQVFVLFFTSLMLYVFCVYATVKDPDAGKDWGQEDKDKCGYAKHHFNARLLLYVFFADDLLLAVYFIF